MSPAHRLPRRKVLVLGKDTRAFLSVVRSLGRHHLEVHVGWCDPQAPAARSRYVAARHEIPQPSPLDGRWRDRLLEILERERFDLVIPCNDPSILPLQLRRKEFAPFLDSLYLLDDLAFRFAFDKLESYELARGLAIPVPRRVRASRLEDVPAALAAFSLPVLVKPRASFTIERLASKHHVRWARSAGELESLVHALLPWGDVAVEERVEGRGVGVEVLAHQGEVLVAFQHVRLHEPPSGGGSSYRRSAPLDPELFGATRRFLEALRYTGVAMLEFKVDPDRGTWVFLEINARFWGSLPLALAAGVDFPYYLYQMWVEGRRDFPRAYRENVYCRNLVNDLLWMRSNWRADRHDPAVTAVPRWRMPAGLLRLVTLREHSDTFVRDDPWPAFAELWRGFRRGARTVRRRLRALIPEPTALRRRRARKAREALARARRVLFVCKGNVCRSPFAHRLAERLLPAHVQVVSCGYRPEPGRACPAEAIQVAQEMGIDLRSHRSQTLAAAMVREADVIFVFDEDNHRTLRDRYAWALSRVHFVGALGERADATIRDPVGGGPADFRAAYATIRQSLEAALGATAPRRGRAEAVARPWWALLGAVARFRPQTLPSTPYMPADDVRALEALVLSLPDDRPLRIFEYGSGGSSVHFPRLLREHGRAFVWFALEHDPRWARQVRRSLARHRLHDVHLLLTEIPGVAPSGLNRSRRRRALVAAGRRFDYAAYTGTPRRLGGDYDLVLVDGRDRKQCLETAIPLLRPGGVLAFHDAQRDYYRCVLVRHPGGAFRTPRLWVWRRPPGVGHP